MAIIGELSIEEKMRLVTGVGSWHTAQIEGKVKESLLADGPHGLRKQEEGELDNNTSVRATCFPASCAIASGWDESLAQLQAKAIANEAKSEGVAVVLGPGVNIKRSPVCGRNFEYYSEDPYLAGKMGTAYVKAMQEENVGTSLKHFAANNQETLRMTGNSRVDERTLREIYLRAFEMVVKDAKPATIMASYNQINGTYSCENKWLLTDVLRNEWGFDGLVVSDWGACSNITKSIEAGMDLEMPDSNGNHTRILKSDFDAGKIDEAYIDRAARLVCDLSEKYAKDVAEISEEEKYRMLQDNHRLAVKIESECAVLLKNNGVLPINKKEYDKGTGKKLLIIGGMAENVRIQGGGSSHVNTDNIPTAQAAFRKIGVETEYVEGYDALSGIIDSAKESIALQAAAAAAQNNEPVIFFGGLTDFAEGEGYDRTDFGMPENQARLLDAISKVNPNTVFVAFAGSPFDMWPTEESAAILMMYLGGEGVMEAMASLVTGGSNPSGKLPETFPFNIADTPCYGNFATASHNADYREGVLVGYRYYDTRNVNVRYPFGHGLSYTNFSYKTLVAVVKNDTVRVTVSVRNDGSCAGAEVVQLYVKNPENEVYRAKRELRAFKKVYLEPGEEKKVDMWLDERAFCVYDVKEKCYLTVPGTYEVQAASSLADVRISAEIEIEGEKMPYAPQIDFDGEVAVLSDLDIVPKGGYTMQNSLADLAEKSSLGRAVLKIAEKEVLKMVPGKPEDDPEVIMYKESMARGTLDSVSNHGGKAFPRKIAEAIVDQANGHKIKAILRLLFKR